MAFVLERTGDRKASRKNIPCGPLRVVPGNDNLVGWPQIALDLKPGVSVVTRLTLLPECLVGMWNPFLSFAQHTRSRRAASKAVTALRINAGHSKWPVGVMTKKDYSTCFLANNDRRIVLLDVVYEKDRQYVFSLPLIVVRPPGQPQRTLDVKFVVGYYFDRELHLLTTDFCTAGPTAACVEMLFGLVAHLGGLIIKCKFGQSTYVIFKLRQTGALTVQQLEDAVERARPEFGDMCTVVHLTPPPECPPPEDDEPRVRLEPGSPMPPRVPEKPETRAIRAERRRRLEVEMYARLPKENRPVNKVELFDPETSFDALFCLETLDNDAIVEEPSRPGNPVARQLVGIDDIDFSNCILPDLPVVNSDDVVRLFEELTTAVPPSFGLCDDLPPLFPIF